MKMDIKNNAYRKDNLLLLKTFVFLKNENRTNS